MERLKWWRHRLLSLLRRNARERDLDDELAFHVEVEAADGTADGLSPAEAERRARRSLGNVTLVREETREAWTWAALERLWQDIRYSVRVLRRRPVFAMTAIASLALGTGANTAVFSLADRVVIEKLPITRPDEIVQLHRVGGGTSSAGEYNALRASSRQLAAVVGVSMAPSRPMEIEDGAVRDVFVQVVTDNYFDALGVRAFRGRLFSQRTPGAAAPDGAVISARYWKDRYGSDPGAIGSRVLWGPRKLEFTIIGVAPPGFDGIHVDVPADIWLPAETVYLGTVRMVARLAPGATIESAQAEVNSIVSRPIQLVPGARGYSYLRDQLIRPLVLLGLLVGLVLAVACANLANLTLAASMARGRELAVRRAIGASRWRVVRQLTIESLVLAMAGGAAGWLLAGGMSAALLRFLPAEQNRAERAFAFEPDWTVFGFGVLLCLATTMVCGLIPAVRATRSSAPAMTPGAGAGQRHRSWASRTLIVGQVGMCALLLTVAGVFIRTIDNLRSQDTGYIEEGLLVADVHPPFGYGEARRDLLLEELRQRAAALPGVTTAAYGHSGQLSGDTFDFGVLTSRTSGRGPAPDVTAIEERVAPGFLPAMGTRLLTGRDITEEDRDGAPAVAIVNQAFIRQFGLEGAPVGQAFAVQRAQRTESLRIVGVVEDAKWVTLREEPRAIYYRPYAQLGGHPQVRFVVRGAGDLGTLGTALRQVAASVDRGIVLRNVVPFRDMVNRTLAIERLLALMSAALAAFALLVASVGLYGVLAYAIERRRREIGIRMAIGAPPGAIGRMMLAESWALLLAGLVVGLPGGVVVTRLAESLLFGLSPGDPAILTFVAAVLWLTTTAAALIPARRAATINPVIALRDE